MEKQASVIVVLGFKLNADGTLHPEFIAKLDEALVQWRLAPITTSHCLITGGRTRAQFPSEAEVARDYLLGQLTDQEHALRSRIVLEDQALATADHPKYVRNLLREKGIFADWFVIITSRFHRKRSQQIFHRLWPEITPCTRWIGTGTVAMTDVIKEGILRAIFFLDPDSTWIMPRLKRMFRSG